MSSETDIHPFRLDMPDEAIADLGRRIAATRWPTRELTTRIDGVDIHLIHVRSPHAEALPLIITHGWPGSVIELLEVVGPLTDPPAHGGSAEDAFDLVLLSLPGYGFSGDPAEDGWDPGRIARAWAELMHRLGYTRRLPHARKDTDHEHRHCWHEGGSSRPAVSCRDGRRGGRRSPAADRGVAAA